VTPCSLVRRLTRFKWICCLHLDSWISGFKANTVGLSKKAVSKCKTIAYGRLANLCIHIWLNSPEGRPLFAYSNLL